MRNTQQLKALQLLFTGHAWGWLQNEIAGKFNNGVQPLIPGDINLRNVLVWVQL